MSTRPATPFDSLSPAEQRRTIATDILAQLNASRLVAVCGTYLSVPNGYSTMQDKTLRSVVKEAAKPCTACAIGSIMLAQLNVNGDCPVADLYAEPLDSTDDGIWLLPWKREDIRDPGHYSPFATRYFDSAQLTLIEIAFERANGGFNCRSVLRTWLDWDNREPYDNLAHSSGVLIPVELANAAFQFGKRYSDTEPRLRAIMAAIIAHPDALFDPTHPTATTHV